MKLAIFNGSPRGEKGNTRVLIDEFLKGFMNNESNLYELEYLCNVKEQDKFVQMFKTADSVILAFPLYTDSMPGIVKEFIESLSVFKNGKNNPKIGFIVQSGFPEGIHTKAVEKYLIKLAWRLKCEYLGTVRKGGVEGIKAMPPVATKKLFKKFEELGGHFGRTGKFKQEIIDKLSKPDKFNSLLIYPVMALLKITGLLDMHWNKMLKRNNAFEKRYDRPSI
jgi:NAD(P)H-dependent FMN reductase